MLMKRARRAREQAREEEARRQRLQELAASVTGGWWHSIDLGLGVVTSGAKSPEVLAAELASMQLPDLKGKSVLDIGAWDGYFSYQAERRGARRVVAVDHYVWSLDFAAQHRYREECQARGEAPKPYDEVPGVWKPDQLPGKAGFDAAHRALDSKVESVVADFMTTDLEALGRFDVVLYLGVLYHMKEPLTALTRLRNVTGEVAVIDTVGLSLPGHRGLELLRLYPGNALNNDFGNWYAVSEAALHGLCRAAGFSRSVTVMGEKTPSRWIPHVVHDMGATLRRMSLPVRRYRLIVRAYP